MTMSLNPMPDVTASNPAILTRLQAVRLLRLVADIRTTEVPLDPQAELRKQEQLAKLRAAIRLREFALWMVQVADSAAIAVPFFLFLYRDNFSVTTRNRAMLVTGVFKLLTTAGLFCTSRNPLLLTDGKEQVVVRDRREHHR
jgi:hypothetical protein